MELVAAAGHPAQALVPADRRGVRGGCGGRAANGLDRHRGRQPWIVYEIQLTRDAVSSAPGLRYAFFTVLVVYAVLTAATVYVLRRIAGQDGVLAPQEIEPDPAHRPERTGRSSPRPRWCWR
jgi:hypothetical protein